MNYKQNEKYICRAGQPTHPRSTIRDHASFYADPIYRVFRNVQRKEFPRLDRRKAHQLLCKFQGLREEFLLSQTTSHRSHEWLQRDHHAKD